MTRDQDGDLLAAPGMRRLLAAMTERVGSRLLCYLDEINDMEAHATRANRWCARAPHVRAAYDRRRRARRSGRR